MHASASAVQMFPVSKARAAGTSGRATYAVSAIANKILAKIYVSLPEKIRSLATFFELQKFKPSRQVGSEQSTF